MESRVCFDRGQGVEVDLTEAAHWYQKAAQQEHAGAQFNLGLCYEKDEGLTGDINTAFTLYRKAAEQGRPGGTVPARRDVPGCRFSRSSGNPIHMEVRSPSILAGGAGCRSPLLVSSQTLLFVDFDQCW